MFKIILARHTTRLVQNLLVKSESRCYNLEKLDIKYIKHQKWQPFTENKIILVANFVWHIK